MCFIKTTLVTLWWMDHRDVRLEGHLWVSFLYVSSWWIMSIRPLWASNLLLLVFHHRYSATKSGMRPWWLRRYLKGGQTHHSYMEALLPPFFLSIHYLEWPWWMPVISIISGTLANILIFVLWSWWRADKPSLLFCLQNNQYHRRKWKALKLSFLNGYSQETHGWFFFPRKVILRFESFI